VKMLNIGRPKQRLYCQYVPFVGRI